jgi:regulator of protease activity HflC (stomatin/prohibitin superfamily)
MVALIVIIIVAVIVLVTLARTIRIVPQARAAVVERLGRYSRTLSPGLAPERDRRDGAREDAHFA